MTDMQNFSVTVHDQLKKLTQVATVEQKLRFTSINATPSKIRNIE